MDRISVEKRSANMSKVKSKDTKPELIVRALLHRNGLRFRLHRKDLPGHPDIVLPKYKIAIFVHGCFWHQHPGCRKATVPKQNTEFWLSKLQKNCERDKKNKAALLELGWKVVVLWECDICKDTNSIMKNVLNYINC